MAYRLRLSGEKFGKLTVLKLDFCKNGYTHWLCKCDCGNILSVRGSSLTSRNTVSCHISRNHKGYNMSKTPFFSVWKGMLKRCYNKNSKSYKDYGGRGIKVCKQWHKFKNFMEDMYKDYLEHIEKFGRKQTSIERINNNSGYNLNNCKWATWSEQNRNKRPRVKKYPTPT